MKIRLGNSIWQSVNEEIKKIYLSLQKSIRMKLRENDVEFLDDELVCLLLSYQRHPKFQIIRTVRRRPNTIPVVQYCCYSYGHYSD